MPGFVGRCRVRRGRVAGLGAGLIVVVLSLAGCGDDARPPDAATAVPAATTPAAAPVPASSAQPGPVATRAAAPPFATAASGSAAAAPAAPASSDALAARVDWVCASRAGLRGRIAGAERLAKAPAEQLDRDLDAVADRIRARAAGYAGGDALSASLGEPLRALGRAVGELSIARAYGDDAAAATATATLTGSRTIALRTATSFGGGHRLPACVRLLGG